jgi:hypothetical protein
MAAPRQAVAVGIKGNASRRGIVLMLRSVPEVRWRDEQARKQDPVAAKQCR